MADEHRSHRRPPTLSDFDERPAELVLYLRTKLVVMSQEELARTLGFSTWTVSRWEGGQQKPSPRSLRKIMALFETYDAALRERLKREQEQQ